MLEQKLNELEQSDIYPFHMPGHKRAFLPFANPYAIDITEIEGFDNLGTAIFTFSGILTAIKLPSIISTFTKFGISISNLIKYFPLLISNTKAYNLVTRSTVATVSAAQLAIGALTAAITIGIVAYNHMKQAQE